MAGKVPRLLGRLEARRLRGGAGAPTAEALPPPAAPMLVAAVTGREPLLVIGRLRATARSSKGGRWARSCWAPSRAAKALAIAVPGRCPRYAERERSGSATCPRRRWSSP